MVSTRDDPAGDEGRHQELATGHDRKAEESRSPVSGGQARGEHIKASGRPGSRLRAGQFVSVQLDHDVLDGLRSFAASRDVSLSVVLREATAEYVTRHGQPEKTAVSSGTVKRSKR